MSTITSTVDTKIYSNDCEKFRLFLLREGFENTKIICSPKSSFLKLHFLALSDLNSYIKNNIEKRFLSYNSHYYYYDLDY